MFRLFTALFAFLLALPHAISEDQFQVWIKAKASDSFERSLIANTGMSIDIIRDDYVIGLGSIETRREIEAMGRLLETKTLISTFDFPQADQIYHNYFELEDALFNIVQDYPQIARLESIGTTTEGRNIWSLQISADLATASQKPGTFFVGGHHAREHLSVEIPLMLAQYLTKEYAGGNPRVRKLLETRDIRIVPALNADGLEFDISTGQYQYWRKNRRANGDRTYGVDLNRNYGYQWGTGGSSRRTNDETYMGPSAFSEPETQAVKRFIESHPNLNVLLSFHTFSELILYPWGYTNSPINDPKARQIHEVMGRTMSKWNGYTPQTSSSLYIASGDLTDWAYGTHQMVAFTFELDPKGGFNRDGFYPGASVIPEVFRKNLEPALYLIEYSDDPSRVLSSGAKSWDANSLLQ